MDQSNLDLLKALWEHVNSRRRKQFFLLIFLTLLTSLAEIVSLGAVLPFIGILIQPEKIFSSSLAIKFLEFFGFVGSADLVGPLAIGFAIAALIAGSLRIILLWLSMRLGNAMGADLSIEIYRRTLYQNYSVHISRSSSEIISGITQKVGTVTSVLISVVTAVISSFLFISIMCTLIVINPFVAIIAIIIFGFAYLLISSLTRNRLISNSRSIAADQTQVVKALQEGLGAIRDVLLDGTQKVYCDIYQKAILQLQRANSENTFINQAPRFIMETLGMALIAMFVFFLSYRPSGVASALPILGMLALGAQKLLPLMQQLYGNWSVVIGSKAAFEEVLSLLDQSIASSYDFAKYKPIKFEKSISFCNVSFKYQTNDPLILDRINIEIPKGSRIGFIGRTGSGKSTTIDILMGLLDPSSGAVLIDGKRLTAKNKIAWQALVAHVPQNIFLADSTIEENIAFGVPQDKINKKRVRYAAEQAQIADFIESKPEGYSAIVGERGIRLSGGQRQRIGIARALYKKASILIFDEATSALDNKTELSLMEAIDGLSKDLTLIIIAHRLSTLKKCSQLIKIEKGRIIKSIN